MMARLREAIMVFGRVAENKWRAAIGNARLHNSAA
jgi:hypothetical protein